jgi:NDP-sugar pyrophosphorylase family protein
LTHIEKKQNKTLNRPTLIEVKDMADCIVICGGKGTRVQSITKNEIPKIMIEVNGRPFVEYLIDTLYSQGVRRIVFAAGYLSEVLEEYLDTRKVLSSVNPRVDLQVVKEDLPLDTGGAVLNVLDKHLIHSNPFLIINGDCLILPPHYDEWDSYEHIYYKECWDFPACAMFSCKTEHDGRYGSLKLAPYNPFSDGMDFITEFKNGEPGESWINCGWYIVRHELFDKYKNPICNRDKIQTYEVQKLSMEKDVFPEYLAEGNFISLIVVSEDQFLEIGTPEALDLASERLGNSDVVL